MVAAINGTALGGGFEIGTGDAPPDRRGAQSLAIGLPEANLGLLPGGGGTTRIVRMFGIQDAVMDLLVPGAQF